MPDLGGRTAIVTGANSGIGYQAACELAAHGARVVLACRDLTRAEQAADRIRSQFDAAKIDVAELNLSSMQSVRAFGQGWSGCLDLLINNAGVMAPPKPALTEDGYELQFGTNHLGHFVLTGLLLPSLLSAAAPRVVTVSSVAHHGATPAVLQGNVGEPYNSQRAYSNSKLANLLFAFELQRQADARGVTLTSVASHPGVAATGLFSDPQGMGANAFLRVVGPPFLKVVASSPKSAARSTLYAATVDEPGPYTGPTWFGETRGPVGSARLSVLAQDEALGRRLWQISEDLTGYHFPWPNGRNGR